MEQESDEYKRGYNAAIEQVQADCINNANTLTQKFGAGEINHDMYRSGVAACLATGSAIERFKK